MGIDYIAQIGSGILFKKSKFEKDEYQKLFDYVHDKINRKYYDENDEDDEYNDEDHEPYYPENLLILDQMDGIGRGWFFLNIDDDQEIQTICSHRNDNPIDDLLDYIVEDYDGSIVLNEDCKLKKEYIKRAFEQYDLDLKQYTNQIICSDNIFISWAR